MTRTLTDARTPPPATRSFDFYALHLCGQPGCINPAHMRLGTKQLDAYMTVIHTLLYDHGPSSFKARTKKKKAGAHTAAALLRRAPVARARGGAGADAR